MNTDDWGWRMEFEGFHKDEVVFKKIIRNDLCVNLSIMDLFFEPNVDDFKCAVYLDNIHFGTIIFYKCDMVDATTTYVKAAISTSWMTPETIPRFMDYFDVKVNMADSILKQAFAWIFAQKNMFMSVAQAAERLTHEN